MRMMTASTALNGRGEPRNWPSAQASPQPMATFSDCTASGGRKLGGSASRHARRRRRAVIPRQATTRPWYVRATWMASYGEEGMSSSSAAADQGRLLLAGDVGGTKTDIAVVSTAGGPRQLLAHRRYLNAEHSGLAEIGRAFLADAGLRVDAACFDVAGPVVAGRAQLTNLDWDLDEATLAVQLGVERAYLINDLVAMASAVPLLSPDELHVVKEGERGPGPIAVLAPGTGLGEAFLVPVDSEYLAFASEGGHASFAPTNEEEMALLRSLWAEWEHVSFERVASGVGIPNLYRFLPARPGAVES